MKKPAVPQLATAMTKSPSNHFHTRMLHAKYRCTNRTRARTEHAPFFGAGSAANQTANSVIGTETALNTNNSPSNDDYRVHSSASVGLLAVHAYRDKQPTGFAGEYGAWGLNSDLDNIKSQRGRRLDAKPITDLGGKLAALAIFAMHQHDARLG